MKPRKGVYTELQSFVEDVRHEFGDTAKNGVGSFGFYIGMIQKVGLPVAQHLFFKAKSSGTDARSPKKLFVWFLKEEWKRVRNLRVIK